jgi:hypothetical protein
MSGKGIRHPRAAFFNHQTGCQLTRTINEKKKYDED